MLGVHIEVAIMVVANQIISVRALEQIVKLFSKDVFFGVNFPKNIDKNFPDCTSGQF